MFYLFVLILLSNVKICSPVYTNNVLFEKLHISSSVQKVSLIKWIYSCTHRFSIGPLGSCGALQPQGPPRSRGSGHLLDHRSVSQPHHLSSGSRGSGRSCRPSGATVTLVTGVTNSGTSLSGKNITIITSVYLLFSDLYCRFRIENI